jgi:hypothetical protein
MKAISWLNTLSHESKDSSEHRRLLYSSRYLAPSEPTPGRPRTEIPLICSHGQGLQGLNDILSVCLNLEYLFSNDISLLKAGLDQALSCLIVTDDE